MLNRLAPALFSLGVMGAIAGFGALLADNHCKRRPSKTIGRQISATLVVLVLAGFCFLVPARRFNIERQRKLGYRLWSPPLPADGSEVSLDFAPSASGGPYRITLRDQKALPAPVLEQKEMIQGSVSASDGTTVPLHFFANESGWQHGKPTRRVYSSVLNARLGTTYHIVIHPAPAVARQLTPAARVVISPEAYLFTDLLFNSLLLSGAGTTLWLLAYGVGVAGVIRIALNRWGLAEPVPSSDARV